jgi:hypothetical protein
MYIRQLAAGAPYVTMALVQVPRRAPRDLHDKGVCVPQVFSTSASVDVEVLPLDFSALATVLPSVYTAGQIKSRATVTVRGPAMLVVTDRGWTSLKTASLFTLSAVNLALHDATAKRAFHTKRAGQRGKRGDSRGGSRHDAGRSEYSLLTALTQYMAYLFEAPIGPIYYSLPSKNACVINVVAFYRGTAAFRRQAGRAR